MTEPGGLSIRRAERDDARVVAKLNVIVQSLHHERAPDIFKPADVEATVGLFREWLREPGIFVYLAELGGRAAGYVLAQRVRAPGHALMHPAELLVIDQLAVDPAERRKGIASALIARVRQLAEDLQISRIDLSVWTFNEEARQFLEGQGFSPTLTQMSLMPIPAEDHS